VSSIVTIACCCCCGCGRRRVGGIERRGEPGPRESVGSPAQSAVERGKYFVLVQTAMDVNAFRTVSPT